jgi:hypothetical protein
MSAASFQPEQGSVGLRGRDLEDKPASASCHPAELEAGDLGAGSWKLIQADVAQLAERVLGKDEVTSSILVIGSSLRLAGAFDERGFGQAGC